MATREPANGPTARLTADEVQDTADTSPRGPEPQTGGKRIRAIPAVITKSGDRSTSVEVRRSDFANKGIEHPSVTFKFDKDNFTLPVGENGISEEAAKFLTENYKTSFEYIGE